RIEQGSLYRDEVALQTCQHITGLKTPTPVNYGKAGLWCFDNAGKLTASYRLHAAPSMAPTTWAMTLEGRYEAGLTTWQLRTPTIARDEDGIVQVAPNLQTCTPSAEPTDVSVHAVQSIKL